MFEIEFNLTTENQKIDLSALKESFFLDLKFCEQYKCLSFKLSLNSSRQVKVALYFQKIKYKMGVYDLNFLDIAKHVVITATTGGVFLNICNKFAILVTI